MSEDSEGKPLAKNSTGLARASKDQLLSRALELASKLSITPRPDAWQFRHYVQEKLAELGYIGRLGQGKVRDAFNLQDDLVLVVTDDGAGIFEWSTGKMRLKLDCRSYSAAVSNDEKLLILSCTTSLTVWTLLDGKQITIPISEFGGGIDFSPDSTIAISPDSTLVALTSFDGVNLYTLPDCNLIRTIECIDLAWGVCFSPDGSALAFGTSGGVIEIIDTKTFSQLSTLFTMDTDILGVAYCPNGKGIVALGEESGYYWHATAPDDEYSCQLLPYGGCESHPGSGDRILVDSTGTYAMAAWGYPDEWRIWRLTTGEVCQSNVASGIEVSRFSEARMNGELFTTVIDSESAFILAHSASKSNRSNRDETKPSNLLETRLDKKLEFDGHHRSVISLLLTENETQLVSTDDRGYVCLWDLNSHTLVRTYQTNELLVAGVCIAPEGIQIADYWRKVVCLDFKSGNLKNIGEIPDNSGHFSKTFSPNRRYVATYGLESDDVNLWLIEPARLCIQASGAKRLESNPLFALSNQFLVVFQPGTCELSTYDLSTGQFIKQFAVPSEPTALFILPNSTTICITTRGNYFQYSAASGEMQVEKKVTHWDQNLPDKQSFAISTDGRYIVQQSDDAGLSVFDTTTLSIVYTVPSDFFQKKIWDFSINGFHIVAISSKTRLVFASGEDGSIHVFNMNYKSPV